MKLLLILFFYSSIAVSATVSRDILSLWDSRFPMRESESATNNIHRKIEVIFNFYGYKITHHDIKYGLPDAAKYKGIVTWFLRNSMEEPEAYAAWLKKNIALGKKVIVFGDPGFSRPTKNREEDPALINDTFRPMGWEFTQRYYDNPLLLAIKENIGSEFTEFERTLDQEISSYRLVKNRLKENKVWLSVFSGTPESESAVIIIGPRGAYVQNGFEIFNHPQDQRSFWRINPFKLIEAVFPPVGPVPDTTTINGRRIFFSHIDGDGFRNVTTIDRKTLASEMIRDEILKKYPFPVTVSVITAEMDSSFGVVKTNRFSEVAREIFALSHVEPASHTTYHPLSWSQNPGAVERAGYLGKDKEWKGPILAWKIPGIKLDYVRETSDSLSWINKHFFSSEKKAKILLWSGSCRPPEAALISLEKENQLNLNGGDSRMDSLFNSVGHLSPLYRNVNGHIQVYSANANENIYTDLWSPPFAGYKDVIQTFERTEKPRRLKPVNVYYHFYSGEHHASIASVKAALDWSKGQKLHPVFASDYAKIVNGFVSTKVETLGPDSYRISGNGKLRTFRIKETSKIPLYRKSKNLLGHQIINGELYLFLGEEPVSEIHLEKSSKEESYLVSTNAEVRKLPDGSLVLKGHLPVEVVLSQNGKLRTFFSPQKTMTLPAGSL